MWILGYLPASFVRRALEGCCQTGRLLKAGLDHSDAWRTVENQQCCDLRKIHKLPGIGDTVGLGRVGERLESV